MHRSQPVFNKRCVDRAISDARSLHESKLHQIQASPLQNARKQIKSQEVLKNIHVTLSRKQ